VHRIWLLENRDAQPYFWLKLEEQIETAKSSNSSSSSIMEFDMFPIFGIYIFLLRITGQLHTFFQFLSIMGGNLHFFGESVNSPFQEGLYAFGESLSIKKLPGKTLRHTPETEDFFQ
jgi:hypothetical protein